MKLITRSYLQDLEGLANTPDIKVITGLRRSGKSKLMESFIDKIASTDKNANIIHINYNLEEFDSIKECNKLYKYVEDRYSEVSENYLFIDEIQLCKEFEKAITWLHASEHYDIYITGSNAFLLSSDLATLFTGRTMETQIFPFSFKEFCEYYEIASDDKSKALERYLDEGGMAGSYLYNDLNRKYSYINDVFNSLIVRDIQTKYSIRQPELLDKLVDFMMDSIGSEVSDNSIAKIFSTSGFKTNNKTINSYINYLCRAFLFYRVRRYDIQGKRYLASQDKYYLCDHSFRYAKLGTRNKNTGRTLENIVAIELLRRGYELYTGVLYNKEIDFVALKRNEKLYIQVADDISNEETFEREYTPLLKIKDAYPKIILARTNEETYDHEGIQIIDLARWLSA